MISEQSECCIGRSRHIPIIAEPADNQPDKEAEIAVVRPKFDPNNEITALTSLECIKPGVRDFDNFVKILTSRFNITKLAQGSFAAVFRMELTRNPEVYTIWKLMAVKPRKGKGSRRPDQTTIENAAAEVKVLDCMQEIHGFVDFRAAYVLKGLLPRPLAELNEAWEGRHHGDKGDLGSSRDQYWVLMEMSDAGRDLDTVLRHGFPDGSRLNKRNFGSRLTIKQTWDIFWSITESLARGEEAAEFEHRDLHNGNICVTNSPIRADEEDQHEITRYTNLRVTLIDYTLSRATIKGGEVLANSMKDPALFSQFSDNEADDRQFRIYRKMQGAVLREVGAKSWVTEWTDFVPITNVFWLYHLLQMFLDDTELYPRNPLEGQEAGSFRDEEERQIAERLTKILKRLRQDHEDEKQYRSAKEVVDHQMDRLPDREPL